MASKLLLGATVFLSTLLASMGRGQVGPGATDPLPCMERLLPCQSSMTSPSPPPSCCSAVAKMLNESATCLCAVFFNQDILDSLNVTSEEGMKLPANCGLNPGTNLCAKLANSTAAQAPVPNTAQAPDSVLVSPSKAAPPSGSRKFAAIFAFSGILLFTLKL